VHQDNSGTDLEKYSEMTMFCEQHKRESFSLHSFFGKEFFSFCGFATDAWNLERVEAYSLAKERKTKS
jgi:hypothetical protein